MKSGRLGLVLLSFAVAALARAPAAAATPRALAAAPRAPAVAATPRAPAAAAVSRAARADSLVRSALARIAAGGHDERRFALRELQDAVLLAPDSARYWISFGRVSLESGLTGKARNCFEQAIRVEPRSAAAHLGLGQVWKRDWLQLMDPRSFERALSYLRTAVALDSTLYDAWITLGPMLFERGMVGEALDAARHAGRLEPRRGEPLVAAGAAHYRLGHVEEAHALLSEGIPRLPQAVRVHFDDIRPLVGWDTEDDLAEAGPAMREEFERRFWSQADPDPTTPLNEARLQYWARVAHAALLLGDPGETRWDMRAELYARYGSPTVVQYNGVNRATETRVNRRDNLVFDRSGQLRRIGAPMFYPVHVQEWAYPELGMSVLLRDPTLNYDYRLPSSWTRSNDPAPDPRALERTDLLACPGGRGVFRALPPGARPIEVRGSVARFEGERGVRLLAQLECPGTPVDELRAQCVVTDSTEHVVARAERELSPSGCEPTTVRTGDFTFDLPPGVYRLAFVVRDGKNGRGITRATRPVEAVRSGLSMSDVVVACGPLDVAGMRDQVRLGPNLRSQVRGDEPLVAYFEVYRLAPDPGNLSRFEYEYSVEPAHPRVWLARLFAREPHYAVRTEEENVGSLRRQFITVPVASLKPGAYRLVVRVRDARTGATTTGTASFERVGEGAVRSGATGAGGAP